jgi:AcrR family transcriptional regulator
MRRSKEDAEKTRQKVIEAALKLFSRNGYSQTTLAMIATEAGYSRGPIYWHFKNKDELFQAILGYSQEPLQQMVDKAAAEPDPRRALEEFIGEWFRLLLEDRAYRQSFEILLNKTELTEVMAKTIRRERQLSKTIVTTLGQRLVELKQNADGETEGLLCYTFLMGVTQSWLFSPKLFSLADRRALFSTRLMVMLGLPA